MGGGLWRRRSKHSGILSVSARLLIQSQPGRLEGLAASIVQKAHRKVFLQARPNMNRKLGFCPVQRGPTWLSDCSSNWLATTWSLFISRGVPYRRAAAAVQSSLLLNSFQSLTGPKQKDPLFLLCERWLQTTVGPPGGWRLFDLWPQNAAAKL